MVEHILLDELQNELLVKRCSLTSRIASASGKADDSVASNAVVAAASTALPSDFELFPELRVKLGAYKQLLSELVEVDQMHDAYGLSLKEALDALEDFACDGDTFSPLSAVPSAVDGPSSPSSQRYERSQRSQLGPDVVSPIGGTGLPGRGLGPDRRGKRTHDEQICADSLIRDFEAGLHDGGIKRITQLEGWDRMGYGAHNSNRPSFR